MITKLTKETLSMINHLANKYECDIKVDLEEKTIKVYPKGSLDSWKLIEIHEGRIRVLHENYRSSVGNYHNHPSRTDYGYIFRNVISTHLRRSSRIVKDINRIDELLREVHNG